MAARGNDLLPPLRRRSPFISPPLSFFPPSPISYETLVPFGTRDTTWCLLRFTNWDTNSSAGREVQWRICEASRKVVVRRGANDVISNGTSWTIDDGDICRPHWSTASAVPSGLDRTLTPSHCVYCPFNCLYRAVLSRLVDIYNSNKDCESLNAVTRHAYER